MKKETGEAQVAIGFAASAGAEVAAGAGPLPVFVLVGMLDWLAQLTTTGKI